jgi:hypothetical protein
MPVFVDTKEALHHGAYYVHATTESFRVIIGKKKLGRKIYEARLLEKLADRYLHCHEGFKICPNKFMYVFFLCESQLQRAIFYITSNNDPNGCFKTCIFVSFCLFF